MFLKPKFLIPAFISVSAISVGVSSFYFLEKNGYFIYQPTKTEEIKEYFSNIKKLFSEKSFLIAENNNSEGNNEKIKNLNDQIKKLYDSVFLKDYYEKLPEGIKAYGFLFLLTRSRLKEIQKSSSDSHQKLNTINKKILVQLEKIQTNWKNIPEEVHEFFIKHSGMLQNLHSGISFNENAKVFVPSWDILKALDSAGRDQFYRIYANRKTIIKNVSDEKLSFKSIFTEIRGKDFHYGKYWKGKDKFGLAYKLFRKTK